MTSPPRKARIAILGVKHFPSQGAVGRIVEDLLVRLRDRYDFTLYCFSHPQAQGHLAGVRVVQFPEPPGGASGVFLFYATCALHLFLTGKYDLVHVHKTDAAFTLPLLTRKFTVIATSHEAPYRRDKWNRFHRSYFRWMERLFIRSRARVTCISQPLCAYYEHTYGRSVEYFPNCVECSQVYDYDTADELLRRHGAPEGFLLMAGRRIIGSKGAHHLLGALRKMNYRGPVLIVGDMSQVPAYTKRLRELAQGLDVKFLEFVSAKAVLMALLARARYFVFPSENEGMSIMLLEAASVRTPVICSDIPENTVVFGPDEVLFFANAEADDLAAKLQWALAHEQDMATRADQAYRRVHHDYNPSVVVEKYIQLYDTMVPVELRPHAPLHQDKP